MTGYVEAFSAIVSEEAQEQRLLRANGTVKQVRKLNSDFLLVKTGAGVWPVVFRDVIAVDGEPVRNREDRLRKLFLGNPKTAVELARAIVKESARHNIGIPRTGDSPLLPLVFLTPRIAPGVRFSVSGSTVTFQGLRSPSVHGEERRVTAGSTGSVQRIIRDRSADRPGPGGGVHRGCREPTLPGTQSGKFTVRYEKDREAGSERAHRSHRTLLAGRQAGRRSPRGPVDVTPASGSSRSAPPSRSRSPTRRR